MSLAISFNYSPDEITKAGRLMARTINNLLFSNVQIWIRDRGQDIRKSKCTSSKNSLFLLNATLKGVQNKTHSNMELRLFSVRSIHRRQIKWKRVE